jgi:Ca2+-binding RTX toxin-like protein
MITLSLAAPATVTFYYDDTSHWATDNQSSVIVTAAGSFQSELGCPGDWDPGCLRSWPQDIDGDGTYSFATTVIPAGTYDTKAAINESWTENYGAGGVPDGPNITFTVPPNATVTFTYVAATHVLSVSVTAATIDTTTAITADDPDPSTVGQAVTIRYRVSPVSGTGTPTGTVIVSDGIDSCTGTVAGGQCLLTFTTPGTRYLTATYSGDSGFNGSTSAVETHTVYPANTAPTATVTGGQCSTLTSASGLLNLTLSDADGDPLTLTLASNSNPTLVPNSHIVLGGSGADRTMTITASAKARGSATIVLNLSDGKVTMPVVVTVIVGTDKNETLNGTNGIDIIFGLAGANTINGGAGNDLLCGGNSNDTINGGNGNDIIDGENGDDVLGGGDGADILRGGNGNDALTGGAGPDRFSGGPGTDTATDLTTAQGDTQDGTIP